MPRKRRQSAHLTKAATERWNETNIEPSEPCATSTPVASPTRSTQANVPSSSTTSPQPIPSASTDYERIIGITLTEPPQPPEALEVSTTRSEKKMSYYKDDLHEGDANIDTNRIRTIVELEQINQLIANLVCPQCGSDQGLKLHTDKQYGLAVKMNVVCVSCDNVVSSKYTSPRNPDSKSRPRPFLVNEVSTMSSMLCGIGACEFKNFCEFTEMPGIHAKTHNKFAKRMCAKNEKIGDMVFDKAVKIVRKEYEVEYGLVPDEYGVMDIAVCFDGSWLTRGHKSMIGVGSIIDVLTGLVLDVHVLSLHCHVCTQTGEYIRRENPQRYDRWKEEHQASGECTINFQGTPGMMEVSAASVLWGRSVTKHGLRYTTMVSDGDSKAFNKVVQDKPYGPHVLLQKEDCLNHVGKRLGTALRNLVSDCSKKGVTLGGRGHGRLTAEAIRKLQIYYSRAIRQNNSAADMKKGILASLYHGYSTDDFPQHQYCPPGPNSWCFYKRSIYNHQYPAGHKRRVHTPLDYDRIHKYVKPIYDRLTADDLLQRCEKKATQNPSESFHHSIWSRCTKSKFHNLKRVQFAVTTAAAEYNKGPAAIADIKRILGFDTGIYGTKHSIARQKKRVNKSIMEATSGAKKRRKTQNEARQKAIEEKEAEEGGPSYQSGMF